MLHVVNSVRGQNGGGLGGHPIRKVTCLLALPIGKSLHICAGFGDKFLAQPWTIVWVTCGHSSAHIRWTGSFHHASRWKNLHPILKVFGLILNSPYKAESWRDELLVSFVTLRSPKQSSTFCHPLCTVRKFCMSR